MLEKVLSFVREHGLMRPGERVCLAVSGGADSVALLRSMLELREETGSVLSVGHFHHGIRGAEADADQEFVRELAARFALELHSDSGSVPDYAREQKVSLETAARELRHRWFAQLLAQSVVDKIATAHTLDDQAETVLMRIIRGTGTRGLGAIAAEHLSKHLVRPLLGVTRAEVEQYLNSIGQPWREDSSNHDLKHTRNRIRYELLPALETRFNPAIRSTLADLAAVAQTEEAFWEEQTQDLLRRLVRSGQPSRSGRSNSQQQVLAVELGALKALHPAMRSRLLRAMVEHLGGTPTYKHCQELVRLAHSERPRAELSLPGGLRARKTFRELLITRCDGSSAVQGYAYQLPLPGEVTVPELTAVFRARVLDSGSAAPDLLGSLLDVAALENPLTIRNWRAGDRFFPAHSKSPKKVKELLQSGRLGLDLTPEERRRWPVAESRGQIVWMRGYAVPSRFVSKSGEAILIEEVTIGSQS